ncbi:DUF1641 domain-containing protein [Haloarchaeobius iranensis]|uniref:DUF1641 domain-containing protein n=1 Tax=Haloarchaeobius iranensis TaxID=996166 RepID=A0A1G9YNY7_9EURY|nr:DUF1641 domain-containing protein [Haloarchaeobius iranensis]SDN10193.1 Protein of unknown function [Haloarchaeobius iranensis]
MSDAPSEFDAVARDGDADLQELAARVDAQADDLLALLDLLTVVRGLSDDLVPELRTAAAENREPLADLRVALENEETLRLVQQVGNNADSLADLLDLAVVAQDLSAELVPELRAVAAENRGEIAQLRVALEREETVVLLRRLGENTDTFLDLLSTLEVASDALADVAPADEAAATAAREDVRRLAAAFDRAESVETLAALGENMETFRGLVALVEGFGDAADRSTDEYYRLGTQLGEAATVAERATDPHVVETLDAGASALADETTDRRVGLLGLLGALRNDDVQRTLGTLVEAAERVGRVRSSDQSD